ncbi:DUF6443 domain-containing protein [Tenacibaculum amylolyticum]|uniref:DUF6443 domain-containing protein n=1 Tax=Tenacibaculum amylolyticum TaxID=104269 RepID=UPI003895B32A
MKRYILLLVFLLPTIALSQLDDNIIIENEIITNDRKVEATNSILIRPNTIIQSGITFTAKIITDSYLPLSLSNENYVLTRDFQVGTTTGEIDFNKDVIESIVYFDGLGRAKQSIGIKQSANQNDIVTHIAYDGFGREAEEYLPYVVENKTGEINLEAKNRTQQYYQTNYSNDFIGVGDVNDINAYSKKMFDNSPLNRVLQQASPGKDWALGNSHEIRYEYLLNDGPQENGIIHHTFYANSDYKEWEPIGDTYLSSGMQVIFNGGPNSGGWGCKLPISSSLTGGDKVKITYDLNNPDVSIETRLYYKVKGETNARSIILAYEAAQGINSHELTLPENTSSVLYFQVFVPYGIKNHFDLAYFDLRKVENIIEENHIRKYYTNSIWNDAENKYDISLLNSGVYTKGALFKTTVKDENWQPNQEFINDHTVEEYKNKKGQIILKRRYNNNVKHDTYYVYDVFGNLVFVIPPKVNVTDGVSDLELSELCYQYLYDARHRLVKKKIAGKGWESIIYDKLNRPVLTQDSNLRANKKWLFTKYDVLGRVIYTGIYTDTSEPTLDQAGMQNHFDTTNNSAEKYYEEKLTTVGTSGVYYSNVDFPSANTEILTVNYYDNYTFDRAGGPSSVNLYGETGTATTRVKGLATGTKVKVLDTNDWITTVTFYDEKARPIYVYSKNTYLETTDIVESKIDFVGRVEETKTTHRKTGKSDIVTIDTFEYDHVGRLQNQKQIINNQETETIVANTYDELGQLVAKKVGGNLQKVDYTYNVRGWLTKINEDADNNDDDLFNFEIKYNNPSSGVALFDGNITQTSWQTTNVGTSKKTYTYAYDALNRITAATGATTTNYNISGITYDKNGNIENLIRRGHIVANPDITRTEDYDVMDNLVYTYDGGNKLKKVLDNGNGTYGFKDGTNIATEYIYDLNGNMKTDANKGIVDITYNHLNLPTKVSMGSNEKAGVVLTGTIDYVYDAAGMKLSKTVTELSSTKPPAIVTEYAGSYIYENNELQFFNHPEGYVKPENTGFSYVYQYKDHLDNVRLSYTDANKDGVITPTTEIIEEKNYYPFGLVQKGYNNVVNSLGNSTAEKFGYNGKELNEELGLEWHDFGARNYDPTLGRWMNIDPLAEEFESYSPYNSMMNNPINFIDPDGMAARWVPDENGDLIAEKNDNKKTLAANYNMSESEAQKLIDSQGLSLDSNGNIKEGQKLTLDNTYTRSIKKSIGSDEKTDPYDGYNCFSSCVKGTNGEEIRPRNEEEYFNSSNMYSIDFYLKTETTPVAESEAKFGKTIIRVANEANVSEHAVVYYGKSNNGTKYAYTKDGPIVKPRVTTLKDAVSGYGRIRGTKVEKGIITKIYEKITGNVSKNTYNSGFYNPK